MKFKPEDFLRIGDWIAPGDSNTADAAAKIANTRLREMLKECPKVVCRKDNGFWACDEHEGFARATHTAHLVKFEQIKK